MVGSNLAAGIKGTWRIHDARPWFAGLGYSKPHKVGNQIKAKLRIEAIGFPTFGLLLYIRFWRIQVISQSPSGKPQSRTDGHAML